SWAEPPQHALRVSQARPVRRGRRQMDGSPQKGSAAHGRRQRLDGRGPANRGSSAMRMKVRPARVTRRLAVAAAVSVVLASSAGLASASERTLAPGSLKVATVEPSSGYFSAHNRVLGNGAAIAVQQIDAKGGIAGRVRIELIRASLGAESSP